MEHYTVCLKIGDLARSNLLAFLTIVYFEQMTCAAFFIFTSVIFTAACDSLSFVVV